MARDEQFRKRLAQLERRRAAAPQVGADEEASPAFVLDVYLVLRECDALTHPSWAAGLRDDVDELAELVAAGRRDEAERLVAEAMAGAGS